MRVSENSRISKKKKKHFEFKNGVTMKGNEINILQLFEEKELVNICAPMVRYSKLQFRNLVRKYNCDLCFTPMILADSFCKSNKARNNEFTTNSADTPLITQFAANTVHDFVGAAYMVAPFCDGVDLNCGCPQSWAKQQGLGCSMLKNPQLIYDVVRECRNRIAKPFSISVKMRISRDIRASVEIAQQLEQSGVTFLSVHGRTSSQLTGSVNVESLRLISDAVNVPVVANGGVKSLQEALELSSATNCKGVMVANGLLTNPTLFAGSNSTTEDCIQSWLDICYNSTLRNFEDYETECTIKEKPFNLTFQCFHHHLVFMLEKILPRKERQVFNNLQTFSAVLNYIKTYLNLSPRRFNLDEYKQMRISDLDYSERDLLYNELKPTKSIESSKGFDFDDKSDGKYFKSKNEECDWSDIFLENG